MTHIILSSLAGAAICKGPEPLTRRIEAWN